MGCGCGRRAEACDPSHFPSPFCSPASEVERPVNAALTSLPQPSPTLLHFVPTRAVPLSFLFAETGSFAAGRLLGAGSVHGALGGGWWGSSSRSLVRTALPLPGLPHLTRHQTHQEVPFGPWCQGVRRRQVRRCPTCWGSGSLLTCLPPYPTPPHPTHTPLPAGNCATAFRSRTSVRNDASCLHRMCGGNTAWIVPIPPPLLPQFTALLHLG